MNFSCEIPLPHRCILATRLAGKARAAGCRISIYGTASPCPWAWRVGAGAASLQAHGFGFTHDHDTHPLRLEDPSRHSRSLDFRVQGQGVGFGSLLVRAVSDGREILSGDVLSNELQGHWTGNLPSHVVMDEFGSLELRLINRAQNSLLPIESIRMAGPQAKDFTITYERSSKQLASFEELLLAIHFNPRRYRQGLYQAVCIVETADAVTPRFEVLLMVYARPQSAG